MNEHRTAVILFAVAVAIVIAVASVTTLERVNSELRGTGWHDGAREAAPSA
jgi:hypothetical protein